MRQYESLRRRKRGLWIPVVALALCVTLSASMLFSRLAGYTAEETWQRIPLTESNGTTQVTAIRRESASVCAAAVTLLSNHGEAAVLPMENETTAPADPGSQIPDESFVWEGQTDVEIFRVSYENGEGQVTVNSAYGDQVLAPGTENAYTFTLHNTGDIALDYTLTLEAWFSDGEKVIPVVARLVDYKGEYLVGSADSYADVLELNDVVCRDSISAGYVAPYTLQWQWPFEGDDAYDTWLGNLAENEDISLTIVIRTVAEQGGEGGLPDTGDRSLTVPVIAMGLSVIALLFLVVPFKRKREDEDAEQ